MYSLARFGLTEMTECGAALRKLGIGARSMEEAADRIVRYFYNQFIDPKTGQNAFALVRLFKTHSYSDLPPELQGIVQQTLVAQPIASDMKCLTLLATIGDEFAWNTRSGSQGHQVIPFVSPKLVAQSPMLSQLIQQLGLELDTVVSPDPHLIIDLEQVNYNVFHVPTALGSPYIPAQTNFVVPYGIESVLGFGGMMPSGNLMTVILFSKVPIPKETADLFKTLTLNTKMALLPFEKSVFAEPVCS